MTDRAQITYEELALILEALDDAAFYRDSRSHVLRSAKRRTLRSHSPAIDGEGGGPDVHQSKAKAYAALAIELRNKSKEK
ncbi:MAG: hypothetical protein E6I95_04525 [Chloroflexi bacterium]|nr:MAG: hypothetical protein E6I95_04525 [Chloroflexota bacterium]